MSLRSRNNLRASLIVVLLFAVLAWLRAGSAERRAEVSWRVLGVGGQLDDLPRSKDSAEAVPVSPVVDRAELRFPFNIAVGAGRGAAPSDQHLAVAPADGSSADPARGRRPPGEGGREAAATAVATGRRRR